MNVKKTYEGYENLWRLRKLAKVKKTYEGSENLWRFRKLMKVRMLGKLRMI